MLQTRQQQRSRLLWKILDEHLPRSTVLKQLDICNDGGVIHADRAKHWRSPAIFPEELFVKTPFPLHNNTPTWTLPVMQRVLT